MKPILLAAVGLGVAAMPLAAQQHDHQQGMAGHGQAMMTHCQMMQGGMGMMGMMGGGMGTGMMGSTGAHLAMNMPMHGTMTEAMRLWPPYVIQQKDALGLTAEQVSKLEGLEQGEDMPRTSSADMQAAQAQLAKAFEQADHGGIRTAVERMANAHAEMQIQHLYLAAQVRGVLTEHQRTQLDGLPGRCAAAGGQTMPHGMGGSGMR